MPADLRRTLSRRALVQALATAPFLPFGEVLAADAPHRIVSLDYALASTLLSLGITPVGVASLADWSRWVVEPQMPATVADIGSSWEINFELLIDLRPDLILTTPYLEALRPRLEKIAPVMAVPVYNGDGNPVLPNAYKATREVGARIGRAAAARAFLAQADALFENCRARIAAIGAPPVVLVSFVDARHARIYGRPGLYQGVFDRLGVENVWRGEGNYWGYQTIGIEELAQFSDPGCRLLALEPFPRNALPLIERSPVWQALPFSQEGHFAILPGVLMFGMVREAMRFASLLTDHLEARQ